MAGESDEPVAAYGGGLSSVRVVVRRNENRYESPATHKHTQCAWWVVVAPCSAALGFTVVIVSLCPDWVWCGIEDSTFHGLSGAWLFLRTSMISIYGGVSCVLNMSRCLLYNEFAYRWRCAASTRCTRRGIYVGICRRGVCTSDCRRTSAGRRRIHAWCRTNFDAMLSSPCVVAPREARRDSISLHSVGPQYVKSSVEDVGNLKCGRDT